MKGFDRNTRTLIVSFVVAIFALVPLKFYEEGMRLDFVQEAMVLGVNEAVVLPEAGLVETDLYEELEAPYKEIESLSCFSREVVEDKIGWIVDILESEELSEEEVNDLIEEIERIEKSVCE
ncbi:hypothetical protein KKA02_00745 [Patescibacteria group bacterium]|nr:hypothetical protein [Patescibacteria group bacterium]